jgi:hypothetical protein
MVKSAFKINKPDDMEATLTMSMTVENWRRVNEALKKGRDGYYGPPQWLVDQIDALIRQVDKTFYADEIEGESK